jgi:biotin carboxylase
MKNTIIIIGAYSSGVFIAPYFSDRDIKVIHITTMELWEMHFLRETYTGNGISENIITESDVAAIEMAILLSKKDSIAAIIPGCNAAVILAETIAEALKIKSNRGESKYARSYKFLMEDALEKLGLPAPTQILADNVSDIIDWKKLLNVQRIVLKPDFSSGSDGVYFCETEEEIKDAFLKLYKKENHYNTKNHVVVAQEYIAGEEYILNTISSYGKHSIFDIWRGYTNNHKYSFK